MKKSPEAKINENNSEEKKKKEENEEDRNIIIKKTGKKKKTQECVELKNIEYKNMLLNHQKSKKKTKLTNIDLDDFLKKESKLNGNVLWNKLDKCMKIKKLVAFAEKWVKTNMKGKESEFPQKIDDMGEKLKKYLKTALYRKKLLKNKEVDYDVEKEIITNIPGLQYKKQRDIFVIKNLENKKKGQINTTHVRKVGTKKNKKHGVNKTGTKRNNKKKTNLKIKNIGKSPVKRKKNIAKKKNKKKE